MRAAPVAILLALSLPLPAVAQERVDLLTVHRIKDEAFKRSAVMDHLFFLTDVNGPRLSNSPGYRAAADWAVRRLAGWGIEGGRLEAWGRFGRGWSLQRYEGHILEPAYAPLPGIPLAWSAGTGGAISAGVIAAPLYRREDAPAMRNLATLARQVALYRETWSGKLRGQIILIDTLRRFPPPEAPDSERFTPQSLADLARAPDPAGTPLIEWPIEEMPSDPNERERVLASLPVEIVHDYYERQTRILSELNGFLRDEGALAVLTGDGRGSGGIMFAEEAGSWDPEMPTPPTVVSIPPETYSRLVRLAEQGVPVKLRLDVEVAFHEDDPQGYNVVAEIPGGRRRNEVVMLGAHLDSWHGGTGATDNASGCAVVLEAMRILKALDLKMDRTVRCALWGGEEQGLFGSRGYVKKHFADPLTMKLRPEHARLAGYFNVDNGSGRIRGLYLQENDMVRPIFEAWLAPFRDLGADTLTISNTSGTDHLPFDDVGLPGFQFIQDPLDYETRTHHSNMDVYDHVQAGDLMQASAILASFVYNAATRPDMLPRVPLPPPLPPKKEGTGAPAGAPRTPGM